LTERRRVEILRVMQLTKAAHFITLILLSILLLTLVDRTAIAQRTRKMRAVSPGGVENASALAGFFKTLASAKSGARVEPVRIMHFGDSHIAADVFTRELRERFQAGFGDGGPGFIVPKNPMSTRRRGVSSGATDGWVIEGIGGRSTTDRIYGPAGISLATSSPGERVWLESRGSQFEIYYVRQPGGGSFEVGVDGASAFDRPVSAAGKVAKVEVISIDVPPGIHRVEVRTLSPAKVRLLGFVAEQISPGVSYDVFGINGARASRILTWNQNAFADAVQARNPDLIVLSYGTNEIADGDWTSLSYQLLLGNIVQRLRAAVPKASILITAPPERADVQLFGRFNSLVSAQRLAALDNSAGFWSAYDAMGGAGSMNSWIPRGLAQSDRVHLTGAGYARLADLLYEDLTRAWTARR
jgi:lysophospholipase L1-like esterase